MGVHVEFIHRLVELVEYAEANELEVASVALGAAVEVIAPALARNIAAGAGYGRAGYVAPMAAQRHPAATRATHLRLVKGGLDMAEAQSRQSEK